MKEFKKEYENVYSSPLKLKKCDLSKITTDIGFDVYEYIEAMQKMVKHFEMVLFDNLVKYVWLTRRFHYNGEQRLKYFGNGACIDGAFGVFMKHYIGTDKAIFNGKSIYKVLTYIKDFFPDIDDKNPFEEKMKFPFKYIGLSYLAVVYQMDDRMEFLNYAEKKKLRYTEFLDYMINHIYSANEESIKNNGKKIYNWSFVSFNLPYVLVYAKTKNKRKDMTISKKYEKFTRARARKNKIKRELDYSLAKKAKQQRREDREKRRTDKEQQKRDRERRKAERAANKRREEENRKKAKKTKARDIYLG